MPPSKTSGNQTETLSDWERIEKTLDHIDTQLHDLCRKVDSMQEFIDLHRPALMRGLGMLDKSAKMSAWMPGAKRKAGHGEGT